MTAAVAADLVTSRDIAERLGVSIRTVQTWRARGVFPPAHQHADDRPLYCWSDVKRWAEQTGRPRPKPG